MKEKICGIYCIENIIDNKKYIGLSIDIYRRRNIHFRLLKNNKHINDHLQNSYNLYGKDSFKFYIIEQCKTKDKLAKREIYYIKKYKTSNRKYGYNNTSGGDGVRNLSEESREKISISESIDNVVQIDMDGNVVNIFRNSRVASDFLKIGRDDKNINMCCNKKYGRRTSCGFYWMYEKDYLQNGFNKEDYKNLLTNKPILQYDIDNNFIAEYESARECERQTGIGYKMISRVCQGKRPHTHGFVFKFKNI